jgi:ubiquitin carboxyl-terminal hydrolase 10
VPVIPAIPKTVPKDALRPVSEKAVDGSKPQQTAHPDAEQDDDKNATSDAPATEEPKVAPPPPNAWATPKTWTELFNPAATTASITKNGAQAGMPAGFGKTNAETLAEALRSFSAVSNDSKVTFLEPRGLVNTGNMCYMNSACSPPSPSYSLLTVLQVLQVLVFCSPFYNFLDQVGKSATHSFKGDTPLIDAM